MARTNKTNIDKFQRKILGWYEVNGRSFPWREEGISSYKIVISEVLLQRTKAGTVNGFYQRFFSAFPSWVSISQAPVTSLAQFLKPLGLFNQRAKRLKNLSEEMTRRNGEFPSGRLELDKIPFVGQYIGNAIELLIFHRRLPLLDVNMARVLERYFGKRRMADLRYDSYLQLLAYKIVDHSESKEISWGILDYAAIICTSQKPKCKMCIFKSNCTYYKSL